MKVIIIVIVLVYINIVIIKVIIKIIIMLLIQFYKINNIDITFCLQLYSPSYVGLNSLYNAKISSNNKNN